MDLPLGEHRHRFRLGRLWGRVEGEAVAHIVGRGGNLLRNVECGKHRSHPEHQPKADARVHR